MYHYEDDSLMLHTDLYQINMLKTYYDKGIDQRHAVFEVYFRKNPFNNGYAIFAGLERLVHYISGLHFKASDLDYLRSLELYDEDFLHYLEQMKLSVDIRAMREGELCFADEPVVQVSGPLGQCQLLETAILNIVNYQTLIATKAARIRTVVGPDDSISEFGARRAQEMDAALWGTRAAYIGGFNATSNVRAGKLFGIPVSGTHAHSLVQAYRDDYQAFRAYAETHRDVTFLVDTYDTLRSGVPMAIKVANEMGDKIRFRGVRIDSGDMAYQSKRIRKMLDEAGYEDTHIVASNDLDESTILNLKMQGAKISDWGIGTKIITAFDQPALGAVYKLVSIEDQDGQMQPTMKLSSNADKMTTPGEKQVWRIKTTRRLEGDYITFSDERPDQESELFMFHPVHTYINKTVRDFTAEPLLIDIFKDGECVYELPALDEIRTYAAERLSQLWEESRRILNPEVYPVDFSQRLYDTKMESIKALREDVARRVQEIEQAEA